MRNRSSKGKVMGNNIKKCHRHKILNTVRKACDQGWRYYINADWTPLMKNAFKQWELWFQWWWLVGGLSSALRLPPRLLCQRATCDRLSHRGLSQSLWQGCALWHHRYLALRRCWPIWNAPGCSLGRLLVDCPTIRGARSDLLPRAQSRWV